jgi:hypothetical protein
VTTTASYIDHFLVVEALPRKSIAKFLRVSVHCAHVVSVMLRE